MTTAKNYMKSIDENRGKCYNNTKSYGWEVHRRPGTGRPGRFLYQKGVNMSIDAKTIENREELAAKAGILVSIRSFGYRFIKRSFDIVFALVGCISVVMLIPFVKVGNMLTGDFAPLFYKTKRIGKDGKQFNFMKFRSMVVTKDGKSAEALLEETLNSDPKLRAQWEKFRKLDNDPRITKMGRFLRNTSLDEFPQFINVLKGDMSLIGPRPLMIGELDEYKGDHERYEAIRPGITGWWAANGRSKLSYDERLELEYWYIENCSIKVDLQCIIRTIKTVVLRDGSK